MKARGIRKLLGAVGIGLLAALAFAADATGNLGLWTLGGSVGMARATYLCFAYIAFDMFMDGVKSLNGDWPFRKAD